MLQGLTFSAALGDRLAGLSEALTAAAEEAETKRLFAEIDQWIADAAGLCQARDPQLDLRGALPTTPASPPVRQAAAAVA